MDKNLIRTILQETLLINESFDKPFTDITQETIERYQIRGDGVDGHAIFHKVYNHRTLVINDFDSDKIDYYVDVSWGWGSKTNEEDKTTFNWMRMTATVFNIMKLFINQFHPPVLKLSNQTDGNYKIYRNSAFESKLNSLFGDNYIIQNQNNAARKSIEIFLINKNIN